jgi:hypothetical protein
MQRKQKIKRYVTQKDVEGEEAKRKQTRRWTPKRESEVEESRERKRK